MTRAVLDVGVVISGVLSPKGAPASLLRSWRLGEFDLIVCPMLLDELRRSLAYPRVAESVSEGQAVRLLDSIARASIPVPDPDDIPAICRDPKDDDLFALAKMGAEALVSGDRDVLEVENPGIRVFTPGGFRELLKTRWN